MGVLTPIDSSRLLNELRYDYYSYVEPPVKPVLSKTRFKDVVPGLENAKAGLVRSLAESELYKHQEESVKALEQGKNLILRSGTGSGKTEAWLVYVMRERVKTLAVYPTLALSNDQIRRIHEYSRATGLKAEAIDALRRDDLMKVYGRPRLRSLIAGLDILITNPAFLLNEVKKMAEGSKGRVLDLFISRVGLIVIDELDFYGPREIALLLSMLRLIKELANPGFRVVVLTATLANPEELASYLKELTGREASIVSGNPFRVENRVYIVLGKNLRGVWDEVRRYRGVFERAGVSKDVLKALDSYPDFKRDYHRVLEVAKALNLTIPQSDPDPVEILSRLVHDEGLTLVFTKSIAKAEELARRLRAVLPEELRDKVFAHHHLTSKHEREEAEDKARKGEVKILVSPRTLSQGIDIGLVARIVHVGLPESVREYHQREGRKGRRGSLAYSETIVLPVTRWDKELLSRGVEALKKWMELPLEKVVVNPGNKYMMLFESLAKFMSPVLRSKLSRSEYGFLKGLKLVEGGSLTRFGRNVWKKMNFYEFAPPYGIKRLIETPEATRYLEDISYCDLVEKFQPGSIDYTSDGVVVGFKYSKSPRRMVTAVVEEGISPSTMRREDSLAYAYEEYEKVKWGWGEKPNILSDYINGRLHSEVLCVVYPPRDGFGRYVKLPNRVVWRVYSSGPVLKQVGGKTIAVKDVRIIEVPTSTSGRYDDFTYGFYSELDPREDLALLRIGLAYLMVVLRRTIGVALESIAYEVARVGERKFMGLHEPKSAGLIESLDWLEVRRLVEEYKPDELDDVLLEALDEYAYSDFITYGLRWDLAREFAIKAIDYILLRDRVRVKLRGRELTVPRPSKALRLLSLDAISLPLSEKEDVRIGCVAVFNGDEVVSCIVTSEYGVVNSDDLKRLEEEVLKRVDEGFKVLIYGDETIDAVKSLGLESISLILRALRIEGGLVLVRDEARSELGVDAPLGELELVVPGVDRGTSIADVKMEYERLLSRGRGVKPTALGDRSRALKHRLRDYVSSNARSIMMLHLICASKRPTRS